MLDLLLLLIGAQLVDEARKHVREGAAEALRRRVREGRLARARLLGLALSLGCDQRNASQHNTKLSS